MESSGNPRASRWSDAPPAQDGNGTTPDKRPPLSSTVEPPAKKTKVEPAQALADGSAQSYTDTASFATYNEGSGYGENRSTTTAAGYGTASAEQSYSGGYGQNAGYGGGQSFGSFAPGSAKGSGTAALFYKTKLCTKFKLGSCTFNERCHFAHGVEDLRKPPPGWEEVVKQTSSGAAATGGGLNLGGSGGPGRGAEPPRRSNKPCRYYNEGNCPYGDRCTFSHGADDAQRVAAPVDPSTGSGMTNGPPRANYKTRICTRWEKNECMYGDKCHFAHGQADLRPPGSGHNYNTGTMTASTNYSDPNIMNPPPMAPYGAHVNYGGAGANPVASGGLNPYAPAGPNMNSYGAMNTYGNAQDGTNGYSSGYSYWNQENKWDGTNSTAAPSGAPNQGYIQQNQSTPWMPNYSVDGGYPKTEATAGGYYAQGQPQQPQNVQYYGSAPSYQDPAPTSTAPFVPDASQTNYQADSIKSGDGGNYYSGTYPNQQTNVYPSQQASGYLNQQSTVYPNQQPAVYANQQVGSYPTQQAGYTGSYTAS